MVEKEDSCGPSPKRIRPPARPVNDGMAAGVSESPHITDVLVKRRSIGWRLVAIVPIAMAIIGAGIAASLVASRSGSPVRGVLIMVAVALGMPILFLLAGKRSEKRIGRILSQGCSGDPAPLIRKAAEERFLGRKQYPVAAAVARELARHGRLGETIRIQWKRPFQSVQPLEVTFEPRLMDEADPAFDELLTAVSSSPDEGASPRASQSEDDVLGMRRIRRNILLKGGWALVLVFGVFLIQAGLEAYQRRTITPALLFWGLMFILTLYGPARGGWFGTKQWLVAPASLIVRKARPRDETSRVRLFERRKSVLCVHQPQRKGPWLVAVADAEENERTIATNTEVVLLLRAWLSPLEPPPVERLSDLR